MTSTRRTLLSFIATIIFPVLLAACASPGGVHVAAMPPIETEAVLPLSCRSDCVTPFGALLGVSPDRVSAYSNCSAKCFVPAPNKEHGTFTGIKWQCVEFARRWLLNNKGVVYGDVDTASDLWGKITAVTRVADGAQIPLQAYLNGSADAPQPGDLLIYAKELLNTGHVAVITEVDEASGIIRVAEQNFFNKPWSANYAREITWVRKDGQYWLLDPYLLGWKRVAAHS